MYNNCFQLYVDGRYMWEYFASKNVKVLLDSDNIVITYFWK